LAAGAGVSVRLAAGKVVTTSSNRTAVMILPLKKAYKKFGLTVMNIYLSGGLLVRAHRINSKVLNGDTG
jgi:hypothetical protein